MISNLPFFIIIVFGWTTLATMMFLLYSIKNAQSSQTQRMYHPVFVGISLWLTLQGVLSIKNIYNSNLDAFPPKIMLLGILPAMLAIITLFATTRGRQFIDSLSIQHLGYLHVVRVPVELVLYWLFLHKAIPEVMTFEGRNFDILAGITAPFIAYFGLTKGKLGPKVILLWNVIGLGLLLNIVVHAILAAPSPIQQIAFEQPNIAILNFPFVWLPTFVVPVVLFSHLVSLRVYLDLSFRRKTALLR